jgi:hypothetical protein
MVGKFALLKVLSYLAIMGYFGGDVVYVIRDEKPSCREGT